MIKKPIVLCINEDIDVQDSCSDILFNEEVEIKLCENFENGLKIVDLEIPEIVIVDALSNGKSTGEFFKKEIEMNTKLKNTKVIILLEENEELQPKKEIENDKVKIINKPIIRSDLIGAVRKMLKKM